MSKYNSYAKQLDEVFRTARDEYKSAYDKLQAAEKNRSSGAIGSTDRQRAELKFQEAQIEFKTAGDQIWDDFNRQRSELRRELVKQVTEDGAANPDAVDTNGLELLKRGILTANDYYALADKYDGNVTMLKLLAKYTREAASDPDREQAERGALYMLAEQCRDGQGKVVSNWDALSKIADYCSGQSRDRRDSPNHIISMGEWWEQLSSQTIENF